MKLRMLLFCFFTLSGCSTHTKTYDFSNDFGKEVNTRSNTNENLTSNQFPEVKIQLINPLKKAEAPGSFAKSFTLEGKILKGEIPNAPGVRRVRIRFVHGWVDSFLVGQSILTLQLTSNGELNRIKEIKLTPPLKQN